MKLFLTSQIRDLDQYTIQHEPISSIDLMERAADALCDALIAEYPFTVIPFYIVAGPGNNGGDALALARKLCQQGYLVRAFLVYSATLDSSRTSTRVSDCSTKAKLSKDCCVNRDRLLKSFPGVLSLVPVEDAELPVPHQDEVVVDGLFGSGLSRPLDSGYARLVRFINALPNRVVAIDLPSGMNADRYHRFTEATIQADLTLSLQFPKLAFFFIENEPFVGQWKVLDIGLHPDGIAAMETSMHFMDVEDVRPLIRRRSRFAHKGNFGHLAVIAGSKGMAGASILAAKAALRSGVGLITLHGPEGNRCILQTVTPEVMFEADRNVDCVSEFYHSERYDALAIGCGLGMRTATVGMMRHFLSHLNEPCVFDADALNIIAAHPKLMELVPEGSILTPHPKEFVRLFGESANSFYRLEKAIEVAQRYKLVLVMKGAYTKIVAPDGAVYFNSTGNPGMATAGSGDVLTGIIGSLLAQGYSPVTAARLGVYMHGLSADLALDRESEESLMAGDIINGLGRAFRSLTS